jgi:hypothetical protein
MPDERFDVPPVTGGDFIKIKGEHLYLGSRALQPGEVLAVSEVSAGVAAAWVASGCADWRKTAGSDAPAPSGTGG